MSSGNLFRRPPVLLALCLVSVGGVVTLVGRLAVGPAVPLKRVEIKTDPGIKAYPAFAPDGQRLAYSVRGSSAQDDRFHVFVRDMIGGASQQLTRGDANDVSPAWSPDGARLAFVRLSEGQGECVVIPAAGGEERRFPGCTAPGDETQPLPALSWMRDGNSLVVVEAADDKPAALAVLSLADGSIRPITHPTAGMEDSTPTVSPDGNTIAFVRSTSPDGADIFICDPAGANPRRLTFDNRAIRGLAWSRDGEDVLYTGARAGGWRVWRLPAYGGSPKDLIPAGRNARYVAVAPVGSRMVYTQTNMVSAIWRATIGGRMSDDEGHVLLRSSESESIPRYSPDGKSIAFISDQTGSDEIWLSGAEGGHRTQLTHMNGPDLARIRWSADGKSLIFDAAGDQGNDLYVMAAAAGAKPSRVATEAINGSFSRDGKWIYFQARNQLWKQAAAGGAPEPLQTSPGAAQPVESLDGKWIYFRKGRSFWRIPAAGGDEEQAIIPEHELMWTTTLEPARQGMYYLEYERSTSSPVVELFDYAGKKSTPVFRLKAGNHRDGGTYSVSPDGKYILYGRFDQSQTNFEVLENFR